ncbi:RecG-like helicase [Bradyrhizobium sp. LM6.10]
MRPSLLNPLFAPVTSLPGVGPKQDKLLQYLLTRNETPRLVDLLLHLPSQVIDRRARPKIRDAVQGTMVTLEVTPRRPPPPAPAPQCARALPRLRQRRHGRRRADLLPSQARLCRKVAAGGREALRLGHAADV